MLLIRQNESDLVILDSFDKSLMLSSTLPIKGTAHVLEYSSIGS